MQRKGATDAPGTGSKDRDGPGAEPATPFAPDRSRAFVAMALPHPLPDELAALIAARFKLLAEPTRIKMLDRLSDGESSVQELATAVGTTQQNVSKHLRALAASGVVGRRKQGNFVYYRVTDEGIWQLCHDVCGSVERRLDDLRDLLAS